MTTPSRTAQLRPSGVHIEVGTEHPEAAMAAYRRLLEAEPASDGRFGFGGDTVRPVSGADRMRFGVADLESSGRLLQRRGMTVESGPGTVDLAAVPLCGLVAAGEAAEPAPGTAVGIVGLDHVVVAAPEPDGAVALFAGVLGLDYRLRLEPFPEVTQLFFRSGAAVVEVVCGVPERPAPTSGTADLPEPPADRRQPSLWGLAWRCVDIDATRARLIDAGVAVRPVKTGRQAGARVATVDDRDLGTRTLLIEKTARPA